MKQRVIALGVYFLLSVVICGVALDPRPIFIPILLGLHQAVPFHYERAISKDFVKYSKELKVIEQIQDDKEALDNIKKNNKILEKIDAEERKNFQESNVPMKIKDINEEIS